MSAGVNATVACRLPARRGTKAGKRVSFHRIDPACAGPAAAPSLTRAGRAAAPHPRQGETGTDDTHVVLDAMVHRRYRARHHPLPSTRRAPRRAALRMVRTGHHARASTHLHQQQRMTTKHTVSCRDCDMRLRSTDHRRHTTAPTTRPSNGLDDTTPNATNGIIGIAATTTIATIATTTPNTTTTIATMPTATTPGPNTTPEARPSDRLGSNRYRHPHNHTSATTKTSPQPAQGVGYHHGTDYADTTRVAAHAMLRPETLQRENGGHYGHQIGYSEGPANGWSAPVDGHHDGIRVAAPRACAARAGGQDE